MNKRGVLLFAFIASFITSCNNTTGGGGDTPDPDSSDVVISIKEAKEFIKNKYTGHELKTPSVNSVVSWNIEKDDNNHGAMHIGMYLTDPSKAEAVSGDIGNNVNINQERAEAFKSELEDLETNPKVLGTLGHEAVVSLTPLTFDALVLGQGSDWYSLTINKINDQSLTITSELKGENSNDVYTRIHTYNKDGYESEFNLIIRNASADYSFTINFVY